MRRSALILLLLGLTVVVSCDRKPGKKTIGVIPKGSSHVFWQTVHAGALKAEYKPTKESPPMFFAFAMDDRVTVDGSFALEKAMKTALRKLAKENPQYLSGFLMKKVHPLLEREAKQMLLQSGAVPRKMQIKRM